jgi:actinorhodin biosynthesis protein ActVIA
VQTVEAAAARRRTVTTEDYLDILAFYARQMHLLDEYDVQGYVATFTEDGIVDHVHKGQRAVGRTAMLESIRRALPHYLDVVVRHWFDHILIEPRGVDAWHVRYYSLVTRTDARGVVEFEPTFTVVDELVRVDEEIRTASRSIYRDVPDANVVRGDD